MSYKDEDTRTTTIEKPTTSILDLIDERVKENTAPEKTEIEREVERFDNSHTATDLNKAYDAIDRANIAKTYAQPEVEKPKPVFKPDTLSNPFFGESDTLTKMRNRPQYSDVVSTPTEAPTLEIKSYETKTVAKKMSTRKKMWIATGAVCLVLLLTLVICNIFSIGALNRDISGISDTIVVQEGELDSLNGSIVTESGSIPEGMQGVNGGTNVDITPTNPTEITPSDNIFNKIAEFFSYLFGR